MNAKNEMKPFAMKRTGGDSAEIVLYGDIVTERPTDWRTGLPSEGSYIILSEFLEELKQIENASQLTVRIHSAGGDARDALTIHNRLKSLNAKKTIIVDGVAMSGGSLIMCAGDEVQVYPGSLIMIHRCWSFILGGYNANDLRQLADGCDATDHSQAAIYHGKTGIETQKLLEMMDAETYMTGEEAVEKGFADKLLEGTGAEVASSADRRTLYVGARPVWTSKRTDGIPAALNIPTVNSGGNSPSVTNTNQPVNSGATGGGKTMANTVEELRREYPELIGQLEEEIKSSVNASASSTDNAEAVNAAVAAEQRRIQAIDEVSQLFDKELVQAAKYGENACTAQELTYRAAQKAAKQGTQFLAGVRSDYEGSGAEGVGAASAAPAGSEGIDPESPAAMAAQARADVAKFFGKKGDR